MVNGLYLYRALTTLLGSKALYTTSHSHIRIHIHTLMAAAAMHRRSLETSGAMWGSVFCHKDTLTHLTWRSGDDLPTDCTIATPGMDRYIV